MDGIIDIQRIGDIYIKTYSGNLRKWIAKETYSSLKVSTLECRKSKKSIPCMYDRGTGDLYFSKATYETNIYSIREALVRDGRTAIYDKDSRRYRNGTDEEWESALKALGVDRKSRKTCKEFFKRGKASIEDLNKLVRRRCILELLPNEMLIIRTTSDNWRIRRYEGLYELHHNSYKALPSGEREISPWKFHLQKTSNQITGLINEIVKYRYKHYQGMEADQNIETEKAGKGKADIPDEVNRFYMNIFINLLGEHFSPYSYSIDKPQDSSVCLGTENGYWVVYGCNRSARIDEKRFVTVVEAAMEMLSRLSDEKEEVAVKSEFLMRIYRETAVIKQTRLIDTSMSSSIVEFT